MRVARGCDEGVVVVCVCVNAIFFVCERLCALELVGMRVGRIFECVRVRSRVCTSERVHKPARALLCA